MLDKKNVRSKSRERDMKLTNAKIHGNQWDRNGEGGKNNAIDYISNILF